MEDHINLIANEQDKYEFVINIIQGNLEIEEIINWIKLHSA